MLSVYIGALVFGGVLIAASLAGLGGHGGELHAGGGDGGGGHGDGQHDGGHAWLSLLGIRFWSFGVAFFGLAGLILRTPAIAIAVGVVTGLGASVALLTLTRQSVGELRDAEALVGGEGRLLLPVAPGQRGKVRLPLPAGGHVDMLADGADDQLLAAGTDVLVVEIRQTIAVVARATR